MIEARTVRYPGKQYSNSGYREVFITPNSAATMIVAGVPTKGVTPLLDQLNDPHLLARIASSSISVDARLFAVKKLSDEDLLLAVFQSSRYQDSKDKALKKLTERVYSLENKDALMHVAAFASIRIYRLAAITRLVEMNENLYLLKVVLNSNYYPDTSRYVIDKLGNNADFLMKVVVYARPSAGSYALKKLVGIVKEGRTENAIVLEFILCHSMDIDAMLAAATTLMEKGVVNEKALRVLAANSPSSYLRQDALDEIGKNFNDLVEVARSSRYNDTKRSVTQRLEFFIDQLTESDGSALMLLAMSSGNQSVRSSATGKLAKNPMALDNIVVWSEYEDTRNYARSLWIELAESHNIVRIKILGEILKGLNFWGEPEKIQKAALLLEGIAEKVPVIFVLARPEEEADIFICGFEITKQLVHALGHRDENIKTAAYNAAKKLLKHDRNREILIDSLCNYALVRSPYELEALLGPKVDSGALHNAAAKLAQEYAENFTMTNGFIRSLASCLNCTDGYTAKIVYDTLRKISEKDSTHKQYVLHLLRRTSPHPLAGNAEELAGLSAELIRNIETTS